VRAGRIEWPTVAVAVAIWVGFALVLTQQHRLPAAVVVVLLGVLAAWYGSLQHEAIHGHPTPWRAANTALVATPLGLVVPYSTYRELHLRHHASPDLTDPQLDPESFHVTPELWARCGPLRRAALWWLRTLSGRMVLGPPLATVRCWRELLVDARTRRGAWRLAGHVAGVAAVLVAVHATGTPWWVFVIGVAWVGGALTMLRSFAEHRWTATGTRSAVVDAGPLAGLLYLNNNLHHTHHARPGVPWFRLPEEHRALGSTAAAAEGAGRYRGYGDVVRRYLFRPFDAPVRSSPRVPADEAAVAATPQPATAG
jgi:fatty acid desaturase